MFSSVNKIRSIRVYNAPHTSNPEHNHDERRTWISIY